MHMIIHTHPAQSGCLTRRISSHFHIYKILNFSFYNIALIEGASKAPTLILHLQLQS